MDDGRRLLPEPGGSTARGLQPRPERRTSSVVSREREKSSVTTKERRTAFGQADVVRLADEDAVTASSRGPSRASGKW